jgi:hypothetical protein
VGKRPGRPRSSERARTVSDGWEVEEVGKETSRQVSSASRARSEEIRRQEPVRRKPDREPDRTRKSGKRVDSPDIESGGSFGG